jgi:hypothetical protein
MTETITYYTADELRNSLDNDETRTAFITESDDEHPLIGGFFHHGKGEEWLVRRVGPDQYLVPGSDFECRYEDGLIYDVHITPRVMAAYEEGLLAKMTAIGGEAAEAAKHPLAKEEHANCAFGSLDSSFVAAPQQQA